ncbi:MAG: hypothetical protein WBW98_17975, partial [Candidatus Sulfotelmatobacter sp.]
FLLRPRKAQMATLLSLFEGCYFFNLLAFGGLSRIDHLWNGPRLHPESNKGLISSDNLSGISVG